MAVAISHTASFEYTNDGDNSHSEAGVAIGSAAADRVVFVMVAGLGSSSADDINTLSIGGISATRARRDQYDAGIGGFYSIEVWWAAVPTGTTAAIAFANDSAYLLATFSVYAVTGTSTTSPVSDSDFASRSDAIASALSVSVDVPANGGAIGLASGAAYQTSASVSWTYLSEDLDNDRNLGGAFAAFSTASLATEAEALGQSVTATVSGAGVEAATNRGLVVVTLANAGGGESSGTGSASGSGAAQGAGSALASGALNAAGAGVATGVGASVASGAFSIAGAAVLSAVGELAPADRGAADISGAGALAGAGASIASAAFSLSGSGTLAATSPEPEPEPVVTFPPVGGGGGFGPSGYRPGKQRFRTRKDKSHPKVITVRIGDWPEDPQIILERREQAERDEFYRSFAQAPFEEIIESGDDEEAALLAILAIAA